MANGYKPKVQVVRSPGNMKQCIYCRFGNPEDAKFCRRAAGQFHRQARPPLGLDSCHDRADAAHVAGYRADLRGDSWRVRRFAQQDVLWHVLSLASWFAALLGSMS